MPKRFPHLDDRTSAFVDQTFNQLMKDTYELPRASLKAVSLIPVVPANRGVKTVSYRLQTEFGMAKIIDANGTDVPHVGRNSQEKFAQVFTVRNMYGYNKTELDAAQFAGEPLTTDLNSTAKYAIEVEEDRISIEGDADHEIVGFINHPNITQVTLDAGVSTKVNFEDKTVDEVVEDFRKLIVDGIKVPNKGNVEADTVLLPTSTKSRLETRRINPDGTVTLMDHLKKTFPGIKTWESLDQLETVGAGGKKRMMAYKCDKAHVCQVIPVPFEQLPVQAEGMNFNVHCFGRTVGTIVKKPLSVDFADGI